MSYYSMSYEGVSKVDLCGLKARAFKIGIKNETVFGGLKLPETRCKKTQAPNASTNGGDASRVGIIKRKDTK